MTKATRRGTRPSPIPNVTAGCKIQVINENTMKWDTLAEVAYTPAQINKVLNKYGLLNGWVLWLGGREFWESTDGNLATRA